MHGDAILDALETWANAQNRLDGKKRERALLDTEIHDIELDVGVKQEAVAKLVKDRFNARVRDLAP